MADDELDPSGNLAAETGNAYEVIRNRLNRQSRELGDKLAELNRRRIQTFGGTRMEIIGRARIRTENNCVPRDIIEVDGEHLLFGYNVFVGMRPEVAVGDVFSLHRMEHGEEGYEFPAVPLKNSFLDDDRFVADFKEVYRYYKDAHLSLLRNVETRKLAVFQTGQTLLDIKVFRWQKGGDGRLSYIDNRGERDHVMPPQHDFQWMATTREQHVQGRHPHVSILDRVFVETVGGHLTIKVEDNTEDGEGIYNEPVRDINQSLGDAQIEYAALGILILLKIRPYREDQFRYLVFNTRTRQVTRIDAIGQACVQLPEDHGLIFPGGYYLQSGETKLFENEDFSDMGFLRAVRSPNGEDVLYVFLHRVQGRRVLLSYNLIRKEVATPIICHGHCLFEDGRMVVFRAEDGEPARVHPAQVWQTPYMSDEYAASVPAGESYLARVGNADLVRGISDGYSVKRLLDESEPTLAVYEGLIASITRMLDAYYWLDREESGHLLASLREIQQTAELILDEFEKVQHLKQQAKKALKAAEETQRELLSAMNRREQWQDINQYVEQLEALRRQRGHLISLKEQQRYLDRERVASLEQEIGEAFEQLSRDTVDFLLGEQALQPYHQELDDLQSEIAGAAKTTEAAPLADRLEQIGQGLDLLNEVLSSLTIDDPQLRTRILEAISEVYAKLNRARAEFSLHRKQLLSGEARAEFGARFKLFAQSVASAMAQADSVEQADSQLAGLMLHLDRLDEQFHEFDEFSLQIAGKRDEVRAEFEARKQTLREEQQRRALGLADTATRALEGIARRAANLKDRDAQNAFFVTDPGVGRIRDIAKRLRELGESGRAEELEGQLKSLRDQAARELLDKQEIFSADGNVIQLGRHAFGVNTQGLELTLIPRDSGGGKRLTLHLTGTDFFQDVRDERLDRQKRYWDQTLVSESGQVYRGEYLAAEIFFQARRSPAALETLRQAALGEDGLLKEARRVAAERYDEGYERGIHDADAARVLESLLRLYDGADLLRYRPDCRALAHLFWLFFPEREQCRVWEKSAKNLRELETLFGGGEEFSQQLIQELAEVMAEFAHAEHLPPNACSPEQAMRPTGGPAWETVMLLGAAEYLVEELKQEPLSLTLSRTAKQLAEGFWKDLERRGKRRQFEEDLGQLKHHLGRQVHLCLAWLGGWLDSDRETSLTKIFHSEVGEEGLSDNQWDILQAHLLETTVFLLTVQRINHRENSAEIVQTLDQMLGQHPRIRDRRLSLRLDEFLSRLRRYRNLHVPGFLAYREARRETLEQHRAALRLEEFKPRPLTTFVRNRLISEVYLPLIGDNFAKQMGSMGEIRRTDQMGLLLLISPPGYGKTTLMEYLAQRMGLVFVKINCPTLGHGVTSLDPGEAPNATARRELEKLNLALEMGNNVMLYLDDIQHSSPEFLQKFISLADAQRRVEGVWQGRSRTHDLRGKRFCVVMAGNPYTESGEVFKIPDMLANRADIYNLGDILGGREDLFALSYLENSLTSNPTLAPLANRDPEDLYRLIREARGENVPGSEFSHDYSAGERAELHAVLKKLFRVRDVLLKVNQQYIASAAQAGHYRVEPPFKLQGSYRNMNKLAEKVVAVMNDRELEDLISDHYQGEAQTLTGGAEENLLKLAELRGILTPEQQARWQAVKKTFNRLQASGDPEADPVTRVVNQLGNLNQQLQEFRDSLYQNGRQGNAVLLQHLGQLNGHLAGLPKLLQNQGKLQRQPLEDLTRALAELPNLATHLAEQKPEIQVVNRLPDTLEPAIRQLVELIDHSLLPVVKQFERKSRLDLVIWQRLKEVSHTLREIDQEAFRRARVQRKREPSMLEDLPGPG